MSMNTKPSCCSPKTKEPSESCHDDHAKSVDWIMYASLALIVPAIIVHMAGLEVPYFTHFAHSALELLKTMWWGIALGLLTVGLMNKIPREYFVKTMGAGNKPIDIFKAAIAGVLLDLCNHGILVISGKLYERGLSAAQVLTFLVSSPWNSLTLTFVLISLIGLKWTLIFTAASMVIAILTGFVFMVLVKRGVLSENPNTIDIPDDFSIRADFKSRMKGWRPNKAWACDIARDGWNEGQMIVRWILFGTVIAAAMNAFIPEDIFADYFGPTIIGLAITIIAATIIEVCSEGSAPIAAEIMNSGGAVGNGFAFLMAGVATDYTEIMVVREFTKSWKIALFLPLITLPQIILLGWIMNIM
ncbi:MAG: permease [Micavibrio sp.]|nr:permease [Micavibrio sp.]